MLLLFSDIWTFVLSCDVLTHTHTHTQDAILFKLDFILVQDLVKHFSRYVFSLRNLLEIVFDLSCFYYLQIVESFVVEPMGLIQWPVGTAVQVAQCDTDTQYCSFLVHVKPNKMYVLLCFPCMFEFPRKMCCYFAMFPKRYINTFFNLFIFINIHIWHFLMW